MIAEYRCITDGETFVDQLNPYGHAVHGQTELGEACGATGVLQGVGGATGDDVQAAQRALASATYLAAVVKADEAGAPWPGYYLTPNCPECGRDVTELWDEDHAMVGPWVAIGCEGYWTVDPASVGLDRGNWSDATGEAPSEEWEIMELIAESQGDDEEAAMAREVGKSDR